MLLVAWKLELHLIVLKAHQVFLQTVSNCLKHFPIVGNPLLQLEFLVDLQKSGGKAHGFNRGMKARNFLQLSDNDVEFCRNVVQATARFVLVSLCVV